MHIDIAIPHSQFPLLQRGKIPEDHVIYMVSIVRKFVNQAKFKGQLD